MSHELIPEMRSGSPCSIADDAQRPAYELAVGQVRSEEISNYHYRSLVQTLGDKGVFEVSTPVGYNFPFPTRIRLFPIGFPQPIPLAHSPLHSIHTPPPRSPPPTSHRAPH